MYFSKAKRPLIKTRNLFVSSTSLHCVFPVSSSLIVEQIKEMSYVPPHKRHENIAIRASTLPPFLLTKGNINTKIIYANDCISRWFLVGSEDNNSFQLMPASSEWKRVAEDKSLVILVKSDFRKLETPWLWVTEMVEDDLVLGFGRAKKTLLRFGSEDVNLRLIARFGKVVFNGANSSETLRDGPLTKRALEKLKKSFHTNVPKSYVQNIGLGAVPKMGFCADQETKELYHVKVSDKTRPDVTISCKCMAELNALRHLILDVSCLGQDLDMRLTVDSKRTLINLSVSLLCLFPMYSIQDYEMKILFNKWYRLTYETWFFGCVQENEIKNLKELTDSAVIDPSVKGGLKWPLGKSSCADRYSVCGVWHTVTTTYRNSDLRLQVREADRYDFRTGIGGTSREVYLKLRALSKLLKEENVERKCVSDMLKDCLKQVWGCFLKAQV
ncbi:unnamed protein product [Thlaspi arvense]|uniref:DUF7903 domain-containing protein n=1 Tax=Thlaspi arvense TaxID=13288 RepID=A0AAU9SDS5_THLAR|nr:unnamed protein product [Thlaspi arvense]